MDELSTSYLSACDPDLVHTCNTTLDKDSDAFVYLYDLVSTYFVQDKKKYKPVARKVRPVVTAVPPQFRINRKIEGDPLAEMPQLSPNPPKFTPTGRYTQEHREALDKAHPEGFLWPIERDLMHHFMCLQNEGFAWNDLQRGRFRTDFFPPVEFPVIPHKPWIQKNIPIPPRVYEEVCRIIKKKIEAGVYEPSNSSY